MSLLRCLFVLAFCLLPLSGHAQDVPADEDEPSAAHGPSQNQEVTEVEPEEASEVAPLLKGIEAAIRDLKAEEDRIAKEWNRESQKRDLEAQEDMAHWAYLMVWATAVNVAVTAAALIVLFFTLQQTRRAAQSAADMVQPAKDSAAAAIQAAKASQASNEAVVRFGELEARAYLKTSDYSADKHLQDITVYFSITNTGNSPAFNVQAVFAVFSEVGTSLSQKLPDEGGLSLRPLAAYIPPSTSESFAILASQALCTNAKFDPTPELPVLALEVLITYQTVFDRERDTTSGELSFKISFDGISLERSRETAMIPSNAFRSGWVDDYLEGLDRGEFRQNNFVQYRYDAPSSKDTPSDEY